MTQAEIKAREIYERFLTSNDKLSIKLKLTGFTQVKIRAKKGALICVDREIELIKFLLDESVNIHQSLSTPKKLCIDILNPKLKELLEIKQHLNNL